MKYNDLIQTVRVKEGNVEKVINKEDFDEKKHKIVKAKKPVEKKEE